MTFTKYALIFVQQIIWTLVIVRVQEYKLNVKRKQDTKSHNVPSINCGNSKVHAAKTKNKKKQQKKQHTLDSIIVTLKPNDCNCLAAVRPDMPAPTTRILGELVTEKYNHLT